MKIVDIQAREILDSRGIPTISCSIILEDGTYVDAAVPSGASVGMYEALELRDGGQRLGGKGVKKAIENIHTNIAPLFIGCEVQALEMDQELVALDPSQQKSELGANATLAVSMALFRAHASVLGIELYSFLAQSLELDEVAMPVPLVNVINGGSHAQNNLSIQEYLIIPYGVLSFTQATEYAVEITYALKSILKKNNKNICVGDEGGFAPDFTSDKEPFDYILQAINEVGYSDKEIALGIDVASSSFYDVEKKLYRFAGKFVGSDHLIEFYKNLAQEYPIIYLEDGLHENDWQYWSVLKKELGDNVRIIGDDLLVTSRERIAHAIDCQAVNGAIIKPNQVGTVSESLQAAILCKEAGLVTVASHRSGETCDTFIADFALGINANYIKCGGCTRGERVAKYNRLMQIESLR